MARNNYEVGPAPERLRPVRRNDVRFPDEEANLALPQHAPDEGRMEETQSDLRRRALFYLRRGKLPESLRQREARVVKETPRRNRRYIKPKARKGPQKAAPYTRPAGR
jgi:hypothetical protein